MVVTEPSCNSHVFTLNQNLAPAVIATKICCLIKPTSLIKVTTGNAFLTKPNTVTTEDVVANGRKCAPKYPGGEKMPQRNA